MQRTHRLGGQRQGGQALTGEAGVLMVPDGATRWVRRLLMSDGKGCCGCGYIWMGSIVHVCAWFMLTCQYSPLAMKHTSHLLAALHTAAPSR